MGVPTEANFLQFLMGMVGQTMMHLGLVENPLTKEQKVDLPAAKYSIDLLTVVQAKTKGNLDPSEAKFLEQALTDLRFNYVEKTRSGESAKES